MTPKINARLNVTLFVTLRSSSCFMAPLPSDLALLYGSFARFDVTLASMPALTSPLPPCPHGERSLFPHGERSLYPHSEKSPIIVVSEVTFSQEYLKDNNRSRIIKVTLCATIICPTWLRLLVSDVAKVTVVRRG